MSASYRLARLAVLQGLARTGRPAARGLLAHEDSAYRMGAGGAEEFGRRLADVVPQPGQERFEPVDVVLGEPGPQPLIEGVGHPPQAGE